MLATGRACPRAGPIIQRLAFLAPPPVDLARKLWLVEGQTITVAAGVVMISACRTRSRGEPGVVQRLALLAPPPVILPPHPRDINRNVYALLTLVDPVVRTQIMTAAGIYNRDDTMELGEINSRIGGKASCFSYPRSAGLGRILEKRVLHRIPTENSGIVEVKLRVRNVIPVVIKTALARGDGVFEERCWQVRDGNIVELAENDGKAGCPQHDVTP